jgi:hypothetical protein
LEQLVSDLAAAPLSGTLKLAAFGKFLLLLTTLVGCASAQPIGTPTTDSATNGNIEMNARRQLFITHDAEPGVTFVLSPGEIGYDEEIERARGIEPGQRKRLQTPYLVYERNADLSYSLHVWAHAPNTQSEPATQFVRPSDGPAYSCYDEVLTARGAGHHVMLVSEWHRISECLGRQSAQH